MAGDSEIGDAEADRIGGLVARVLEERDQVIRVVTLHHAVTDTAEDERERRGDTGATRQLNAQKPEPAALQCPLETGVMRRCLVRMRTRVRTRRSAAGW